MDRMLYEQYLDILKRELVPAMGCTEPIAIAYAASLVRDTLGAVPEEIEIAVSSNIIKNVKSVVVPHTGGLQGIPAAVAVGIIAGRAERELEVIADVSGEELARISEYMQTVAIKIRQSDSQYVFDIQITARRAENSAYVRIAGFHTNVIRIEKDGEVLLDNSFSEDEQTNATDYTVLNVRDIIEFAETVDIDDVRGILDRQIEYNMAISDEGLTGKWGARIGRILLESYGTSVHNRAKAAAAAGSDARMSGCELPVVITSGSGNQGMTTSIPVIVYARELEVSQKQLYRALTIANLITIHMKTGIGRLSAYCGATSAGCGAAAGITYLYGGKENEIAHTIVNAVAINSGMICDGAKPSCAAKIASAVEAGLIGMQMQMHGSEFYGGDGIVAKGVEETIDNVGCVARLGMVSVDKEIIKIMINS